MSSFYKLKIKSKIRQTDKAVQLVFDIPQELKETFQYRAGQYVTLSATINNEDVRRSYSISSGPDEDLSVVVKAIENGLFSNYVNTQLKVENILEVMPPEGHFVIDNLTEDSNYCAFVAGSGITPVMSMIKTVLNSNSKSKFVLVYGNKSYAETIFYNELNALKEEYSDRLFVEYICSQTQEENARFGRIDKSIINFIYKNKYKELTFKEYFLCGPELLIDFTKSILIENGVNENDIKYELFYSSKETEAVETLEGVTKVSVIVDEETHQLQMNSDELVLDAILREDIDVPYSCQGGICSSCIAQVKKGKAIMQKNQILTESEVEQGLILTCQAIPQTHELEVDFDDI